jgi:tetratricopeptide (TPR) repeat protein
VLAGAPMRVAVTLVVALLLALGCARHRAAPAASPPILFDDLGTHHHPVTTRSPEAQRWFDQGLRLVWAFNHDEATRAFQEAARLDPDCAMAWWGIALAAGPNYNDPGNPERDRRAYEALQHAVAARDTVTERERAYVDALAKRYTKEPPPDRKALDAAYADAMRDVARRYPDDLDAATLFAESMMDLRPWDLWAADGSPQPGTAEIVATLEAVLARDPQHPGANHYYIHAVEASAAPERGLESAKRLHDLVPGAGHLVHMPSHIYMRVGRYADAADANVRAIAVDERYIASAKPAGMYPMMYYPHNVDFLWNAASMEGRSADTIGAARKIAAMVPAEAVRQMPDIENAHVAPLFALARFGRWDEILKEPAPADDLPFATGTWHYARGLAFARTGRLAEADAELAALGKTVAATPGDRPLQQVNKQKTVLGLADAVLAGEIAAAHGRTADAVRELRKAVRIQDGLRYMEPPPWYYPVRQSLGAVLLSAGRAKEAEAVYREDLRRNPENGWSLYGLARALRAEKQSARAAAVEARFRRAWSHADVELTSSRL